MNTVINTFAIIISLLTATGVFVHEAHVDRATATSVAARKAAHKVARTNPTPADANIGAEPHTHPEHGAKTLRGFSYKSPKVPPREQRAKKHLLQNHEPRGRHAFDNHYLPLVT